MRQYTILVKTGKDMGATTDDDVFIKLHGNSTSTQAYNLRTVDPSAFHVGNEHDFVIQTPINLGEDPRIELWRLGDDHSTWYVDWVEITYGTDNKFLFLVEEWTRVGMHYTVKNRDTCLPQNDSQIVSRQKRLKNIRNEYVLHVNIDGLPAQVGKLPDDEAFSAYDKLRIEGNFFFYTAETYRLLFLQEEDWANVEDVKNVYSRIFGVPQGSRYFNDDASFGRQRLNGLNSSLLKRCYEIPQSLREAILEIKRQLKNKDIDSAFSKARLFIVDLSILQGCPTRNKLLKMPSPIALFYFNDDGCLMPIAIKLFQDNRTNNPIFLPSDPEYTWMAAKMWYSLADATYHQAITHLNFTHLMMEGISVASKRNLALPHPIMKLLKPHFTHLMAINSLSLSTLIKGDGIIDRTSNAGIRGHFHIMRKSMDFWRLDVHGTLPRDLQERGVFDPDILKGAYHMRDDALLLYTAIKNYVTEYVHHYYVNDSELLNDDEIQNWRRELVTPRNANGVGILGVPGNDGFNTPDELILTLTAIIYQCSVGHAAANFQQYDEYGSPFNYPYFLDGTPPGNKSRLTREFILGMIAKRPLLLDTMSIAKVLSTKPETSLGNFEDKSFVDPHAAQIVKRFREELKEIGNIIHGKNIQRKPKYVWLHPTAIPNSINI